MVSFCRLCKYIFLNRPPGPRSPFHTPYMTLLLKPGAQHKARGSTTAWEGPYPCPHCAWPYCTPGRPWGRRLSTIPFLGLGSETQPLSQPAGPRPVTKAAVAKYPPHARRHPASHSQKGSLLQEASRCTGLTTASLGLTGEGAREHVCVQGRGTCGTFPKTNLLGKVAHHAHLHHALSVSNGKLKTGPPLPAGPTCQGQQYQVARVPTCCPQANAGST